MVSIPKLRYYWTKSTRFATSSRPNARRERLIREHNQSVRDALKTPDEDEELASSLADELLEKGSITLGWTRTVDDPKPQRGKKRKRSRKIGTRRGKRV